MASSSYNDNKTKNWITATSNLSLRKKIILHQHSAIYHQRLSGNVGR